MSRGLSFTYYLAGSLLLLLVIQQQTEASRLLLIPASHGSHVNFFAVVGEVLHKAGHDVSLLVSSDLAKRANKPGVTLINMGEVAKLLEDEQTQDNVFANTAHPLFLLRKMASRTRDICEQVLANENLMMSLEEAHFDLVIIDSFDLFRCMYVIPYRLDVPFISAGARHDPWSARIPALPSTDAQQGLFVLGKHPSFMERLQNTMAQILINVVMPPSILVDPALLTRFAPKRPSTTFSELYQKSEMWIINLETMCLDSPRVHGFHYQFIGGLSCRPAAPLPQEMAEFVQGADDGVILVTFGSGLKKIPMDMLSKMLAVFKQLPQRVIMRYDGPAPEDQSHNVLLSKWLPQNDLLGHPKTKLFITHGGNNGQLEAVYHGVPMLTMPVFGDQFYNAERAAKQGLGLTVDAKSFTIDELHWTVKEMLDNPKYTNSIKRCSRIIHNMPNPQDSLTFWVNHVLEFGGSHLKPQQMEMPLWQFFMIDIILFFIVVIGILLCCFKWCCLKVTRRISGRFSSASHKGKTD